MSEGAQAICLRKVTKIILRITLFYTMKIYKSGEGVVWWRTLDKRVTCHNRMTVTCEKHPLKSPRFKDLNATCKIPC